MPGNKHVHSPAINVEAQFVESGIKLDLNIIFSVQYLQISLLLSCAYVGGWFSRELLSTFLTHP